MTTSILDSFADHTVLGGPVRVYRCGSTGLPVLLLHGAMLDTARGIWHDVIPALAEDHQVLVIDMPRHGASRPWSGWLGDEFYRRFLPALLDELGLDRAAVMGLSMGGGVGIRFALEHPERVSALIAVNPGGLGEKRPHHLLTWTMLHLPGLLRVSTWILARFPGYVRSSLIPALAAGESTAGFERIIAGVQEEAREKQRFGELAMDDWQVDWYGPLRTRFGRIDELRELAVPTLWVHGDDDPLISHEEMAAAHAATPGSRFETLADAGHLLPYDQPEKLSVLAREFLAELAGGADE